MLKRCITMLNPKNLAREVRVYGYYFSWKNHLVIVLASMLGTLGLGVLFQLDAVFQIILVIAMLLVLPNLIVGMYRIMYEQKRFADALTYMEQILYAFQKTGKVMSALEETMEVFEPGQMRDTIQEAIDYLQKGQADTEDGVLREGLHIIEKVYECSRLHTIHGLLVNVEEHGGEMEQSIYLLLNDLELWKRRSYHFQSEKKKNHSNNTISVICAVLMSAAALYVLMYIPSMFQMEAPYNIFKVKLVQITSCGFLLFLLYTFWKSMRSLNRNWLQERGIRSAESVLSSYRHVVNYDEEREKKKSLIWAAPFFVAAILLVVFGKVWMAVPVVLIAVFMLRQHAFGRKLAIRAVSSELYLVLPEWLMEMALLLQNNTVQVAIAKSIDGAPEILKPELYRLVQRLQEKPGELSSYTDFCKEFDVPEAASCMKMLHAVSEAGTGDARVQIHNLIMRVQEMQNQAEEIRLKDNAFRVKMLFYYPVIGVSVKLFGDLIVGMAFMFQVLGKMGGM